MALGYQNFFSTSLTTDITSSTLTINLDNVPTVSEGILVIDPDSTNPEIIYYTSKTGVAVVLPSTGNRGYDSTTAAPHFAGTPVIMAPVAAYFSGITTLAGTQTVTGDKTFSGAVTLGGAVNINSDNISGAWTSYTPTWTASSGAPTIGNGTLQMYYKRIGTTVKVRFNLTIGSTTSLGTSSGWIFSLPITASSNIPVKTSLGTFFLEDLATRFYSGLFATVTATTISPYVIFNGTGSPDLTTVSYNTPMTWATGDYIRGSFEYEAA